MHDVNHSMYALRIVWNVDVVMCHCMCILGGSSPRRRIQLLSIAHLVVGPPPPPPPPPPFQVQRVFKKMTLLRGRDYEAGRTVAFIHVLCMY